MKFKQLKAVLALVAALAVVPAFAGDALYDPADNSHEITLAAVGIVNEAEVNFETICESERVGNSICVLCEYTAIGETSHFSQQGEGADIPDNSPIRFGRAMPIIDPSNPGNSYLMYKLIINTNNQPNISGPFPLDPMLVSEIGRLRDSVVVPTPLVHDSTREFR